MLMIYSSIFSSILNDLYAIITLYLHKDIYLKNSKQCRKQTKIMSEQIKDLIDLETMETLTQIAQQFVSILIPLPQTTALIMKNEIKLDRIDAKLMKQAEKLNKKQMQAVKREFRQKQRVGAITYRSYTIQFKKDLIKSIRQQAQITKQPLSKLIRNKAKETGIHPKNITRWYHTKELKKKEGGRRALYPEMEIRLAKFILNNPKMKRKVILRQAKQIMEDLKIPGRNEFNFSKGWYERFRERLNKKKVTKGAKIEDILKLQAKQQYDDVKKQEYLSDNEEFDDDDDQDDYDDNVKFEENLSDSDDKDEQFFKVKLDELDAQDSRLVKQEDLFFESEEQNEDQVKYEEETSTGMYPKMQNEKIQVDI